MGYAGFSRKEKSHALCRRGASLTPNGGLFGKKKRGIAHEASLTPFLLFCNQLL
jgi:hypothetical protein